MATEIGTAGDDEVVVDAALIDSALIHPRPSTRPEFEPLTATRHYDGPRAQIDPDPSKGWMRRVLPLLLAHRPMFLATMGASIITMGSRVLSTRYAGEAVNEALAKPPGLRAPLSGYVVTLLVLAVAGLTAGMVSRYYLFRVGYEIEFDLRVLMYRHLTRLSFGFYDRVESGQLISRANSDIRALQMFLAFGPFMVLQFGIFFFAMYYMVQIDVVLTLVSIVTLPFVYLIGVNMRKYMFPISWIVQARMADVAMIVDENINGVRVVKSFAAEEHQIATLSRAAMRLQWVSMQQVRLRAKYGPLLENVTRVGEALILLYGGLLVIDGRIGPGDILMFMAYLAILQAPFRMLGFMVMMQQRAAASAQRIYEVLDEVPELQDHPGAVDLIDCRGDVEFRDVQFSFHQGPRVLDGFSLHVRPGETVAIVGRTGSGKSTIAELVPRFYDVNAGAVLIDGQDVRRLTMTSLRAHTGICFDEPFLFSASVRDNIAYGRPSATLDEVIEAAKVADAHRFIMDLEDGYDTVVGERGYTLSGGQRQRIAIARTLLEDPPILILDDATSAIDVQVELQIHDALRRLLSNRTTLIIAHRLSTISLADRVVLIEGGRVVADGTHLELMATEPRYAEVLAHLEEEDGVKAGAVEDSATTHPVVDLSEGSLLGGTDATGFGEAD